MIRRFLDQAAFKAGQEGAVIMLGLRPDTISALLLWGLQDRANSVALVPVSAVLTRE
ncbi:divergent polysaccharide deacetylase family protein [Sulfitobacter porphyrae]|uniref:Divergent polysaccharide deacetylase family protein n=1 Tax=Sulfitobacter porphyrae TaxID=1246864 RepID=A0ABW2B1X1_9RHOB